MVMFLYLQSNVLIDNSTFKNTVLGFKVCD